MPLTLLENVYMFCYSVFFPLVSLMTAGCPACILMCYVSQVLGRNLQKWQQQNHLLCISSISYNFYLMQTTLSLWIYYTIVFFAHNKKKVSCLILCILGNSWWKSSVMFTYMILHFLQFHSKLQVFLVKSLYGRSYLQKHEYFFCLDNSGQ